MAVFSPTVWRASLAIALAFVTCAAIGMVINPAAFSKFFFTPETLPELTGRSRSYYWDIASYAELALKPACSAFYPLWAGVIRGVFQPQSVVAAGRGFLMMATGLFFLALPLAVWLFQRTLGRRLGLAIALLYTLSPMAIFRVNGYSEGLFGVLSLLLLWVLLPLRSLATANPVGANPVRPGMGWGRWLALPLVTGLMALARPVMVPMVAAAIATLLTLLLFAWFRTAPTSGKAFIQDCQVMYCQPLQATGVLTLAAIAGYAIYGEFCLRTRGNFFAPFQDQSLWKKALGIHPELLLLPKSPLIDLWALYLPALLWLVGFVWVYFTITGKNLVGLVPRSPWWFLLCLYPPALILGYGVQVLRLKFLKPQDSVLSAAIAPTAIAPTAIAPAANTLETNYVFWFSVYFALSHAAIAFFTQDRLVSLGRYVFALPFIFLALGYLVQKLPTAVGDRLIFCLSGLSALYLIQQWIDYGHHQWLG